MRGVAQRQLRTSALGAHDEDYEGSRIGGDMANGEDDGTPEPIRIDVLSPHLASEAGDLLAASHADYPSFTHLFPDPPRRRRVLRPFMSAAARDAALHARAMAASDDNGIVGVALWMPPGTFPLSLWRKARMAPALLRAALSARGAFPAFARVGATLEKVHPRDSSWYLQAMGVHPRAQRRGVGRRLLSPTLALADEAGLPCHLHTSDPANIAYYERFGFEVSQPAIEVFAHRPHYIGMTRSPRTQHSG
jgi:ribosomal protein S18 acetylase RimI-like enzyme